MKRLFALRQITASVASPSRPCLITSRETNVATRPHACSRPCAFDEGKNQTKTHREIHSSPVTVSNSRLLARKHVPRVSPYAPVSIDPEFVEIGLVQLSQTGIKDKFNVTRTHLQIPKGQLNNGTLYLPRYEEAFLFKGKKWPRLLRSLGLAFLPVER